MNKEQLLEIVKKRGDEVFEELMQKNELLRDEDFASSDPDKYQEVDFEATRLDGQLEELNWFRKLLEN
jgi:hypothetical protein